MHQAGLPADAKVGKVQWTVVDPSGKSSKKPGSGRSALTIAIRTAPKWPYGQYSIEAVVHTEEYGQMSGQGVFTLKESEFIHMTLKKTVHTGQ